MPKSLLHNLALVVAVFLAYFVTNLPELSGWTWQTTALLVIIYLCLVFAKAQNRAISAFLFTSIIFVIVFVTGGVSSPVFFLLYFLLFGVAFLFEPWGAISLAVIATVFFLLTPTENPLSWLLTVSSLFLIAPIARIFASQYEKLIEDEQNIRILTQTGRFLHRELSNKEYEVKSWTEQDFKSHLMAIWAGLNDYYCRQAQTSEQKQKLLKVNAELSRLLASAEEMKQKVNNSRD